MKISVTMFDTIRSLRPDAKFALSNDKYDTLEWYSDPNVIPIPTKEDVLAEFARLIDEHDAKKYRELRAAEYPLIGDQLDDLFHSGMFSDEMRQKLQAVKDKYPKP